MWNIMWKMCENSPIFTLSSLTFHMHFTHIFRMHVKFCIVKYMWKGCEAVSSLSHTFSHTLHIEFHTGFHMYMLMSIPWFNQSQTFIQSLKRNKLPDQIYTDILKMCLHRVYLFIHFWFFLFILYFLFSFKTINFIGIK